MSQKSLGSRSLVLTSKKSSESVALNPARKQQRGPCRTLKDEFTDSPRRFSRRQHLSWPQDSLPPPATTTGCPAELSSEDPLPDSGGRCRSHYDSAPLKNVPWTDGATRPATRASRKFCCLDIPCRASVQFPAVVVRPYQAANAAPPTAVNRALFRPRQ